jgi:hypothetical protein
LDTEIGRSTAEPIAGIGVSWNRGWMVRTTLTLAAIYLAAIGLALIFFPLRFGVGAVPPDATPQLIALLRLLGGPFLGIAVLDWLSRSGDAPMLKPVLLANLIGFGAVAANDVVGIVTSESRELAKLFVVIHLAFTAAFAMSLTIHRRSV